MPLAHPDWLLTPERAALHVPSGSAVIADVHLGYTAARRARGEAIPDFTDREAREQLATLLRRYRPTKLVVAGDWVERPRAAAAAVAQWHADCSAAGTELLVIRGNHDEGLRDVSLVDAVQVGGWTIRHEIGSDPDAGPSVGGHWHPVLRLPQATGQAACFLLDTDRLLLPAFSREAAGGNVFRLVGWDEAMCWAIAGSQVLPVGRLGDLRRRHRPGSPRHSRR